MLMLQELVMFNVVRANDQRALFSPRSYDWVSWLHGQLCGLPCVWCCVLSLVCDFLHLSHIGSLKTSPERHVESQLCPLGFT